MSFLAWPTSVRRLATGLALAALLGSLILINARPAAAAGPCGPPVVSVIACENTLPGDPTSDWQVSGSGDSTIQGFAAAMSVNPGQAISFKINTPLTRYHIDILRVGYYQGDGARKVVSGLLPSASLPQTQPACKNDTASTGLVDCGNWAVSASWTVPSTAVSGLYLAHLKRDDTSTGNGSLIPFVVRNDTSHSDILFQTNDESWEAYNTYPSTATGPSLYQCTTNCPPVSNSSYTGASKVSYNRPWQSGADDLQNGNAASWFMYAEYPMIRFLEENGYDVSYTSGLDVSQPGYASTIEQHKIFLTSGHDEYWTGQQRANVTAARDAGVNMAFFTGNEVFWKTRLEPSIDGSNTPNRTLVAYKETHYDAPVDPQDPPTWTGSWMDPRFSPPGDGGQPQNALTGQLFDVNANAGTVDIQVPASYSKLRFWRNTRVASLASGQLTTLDQGVGTLGYEWDVDADNGFRPAGLLDMSSTTYNGAQIFTDYGSNTTPQLNATATHHLTLYRAASGALVFGAGTVQWAWGLDNGTGSGNAGGSTDLAMQQATVNLFADMGNVQPASLTTPGVTAATPSADTTAPTSTITSPAQGANLSNGSAVTISGNAVDAGGGVVAGVEVSTDGGTTWHPVTTMSAAGTSVTWSYSWVAHGSPTATIESRAVDDSGNLEKPGAGITVNMSCPCSIWGPATTPGTVDSGDPASIEVGVKFQADAFGYVTGIRFYKASANTGTHIGNLWAANGQLLASATFTGETASGWQQVNFSQPVQVNKNTTYIASYFAPKGHYSADGSYFYTTPPLGTNPTITNVDSPPLHALRNTNGVVNGVFSYAGSSTFPTSSTGATNYYVDPVFTAQAFNNPPGQVGNVSATAGYASATVTWSAPTTGDQPTSYTITPYIGSAAQTATTVPGNPAPTSAVVSGLTNGTTYTFTVTASNPAGTGPESPQSNAVTPSASALHVRQRRLRERPDLLDDRWRGPDADRYHHPVPLRQQFRLARHGDPCFQRRRRQQRFSDRHHPSHRHDGPEFLVPAEHSRRHLFWQRLHVRLAGGPDPHHGWDDAGQRLQEQLELAAMDPGHRRHDAVCGPERGALVQRARGRGERRHLDVPGRRVALPAVGAVSAYRSDSDRGQWLGHGQLDGAVQQWRQHDHQVHGDAVHRLDRADAGDGDRQSAGHLYHGDRADQRHRLHIHRDGDQRERHQPGFVAVQ